HPLPTYTGSSENNPVVVCEGASDTAALLGLDLDAVGVPMPVQCGAMLAQLLTGWHAVIVRDRDDAGARGARKLAQALAPRCAPVRVSDPPLDANDARDAVVNVARSEHFISAARASNPFQATPTGSEAKRNEFDGISIDQLGPAEEPDWLWQGYLVRGSISLLTGLWKAGKSTLLAHLLRDLYRRSGLVNRPISGPVLIVSEEPDGIWSARREDFQLDNRIRFLRRPSFARPSEHQWLELVACIIQEANAHSARLRGLLRKASQDRRWTESGSGHKGDPLWYRTITPQADPFRYDLDTQVREATKHLVPRPSSRTNGKLASRDICVPAD
ncbi:MAG: AAA family ATPase, partial [Planctomycetota bacterium]